MADDKTDRSLRALLKSRKDVIKADDALTVERDISSI